jgi:hypothetical protein
MEKRVDIEKAKDARQDLPPSRQQALLGLHKDLPVGVLGQKGR